MICIQLNGGLGNQMFQYAFGKACAIKNQTDIILDISRLERSHTSPNNTTRSLEIHIFNSEITIASVKDLKKHKPIMYKIANVIAINTGYGGIQTSKYFIENKFYFNKKISLISTNCFISGYWQSYLYFNKIKTFIDDEYKFPELINIQNRSIMKEIKTVNSISLHIRRTDYINNNNNTEGHIVCSVDYYLKAVAVLSNKVVEPVFFIFSDDINWAKKNIHLKYPCKFISNNTGKSSYIDMQLMSNCKHNIISNSSFSWWGAWLNKNPEKIVVAPKYWYTDENRNAKISDLIPRMWFMV
jgi:hypothetical protein